MDPDPPQKTVDLKLSHALLGQIVDNAPMLLFVRDLGGHYIMVNRIYEQLIGMDRSEILGRRPQDLFPAAKADMYLSHDTAVIMAGRSLNFEESSVVRGEERHWLAMKMPVYDESGRIAGVAGMSTEITARKKAERQLLQLNRNLEAANLELRSTQEMLIQAEKLESVGRLAAGVAHEVKNPLALILMGVEYLSQLPDDVDPNFLEILEEMRKAVRRAEKIIHGLVDFSASRHLEFRNVDLNQVIRDTLLFTKHDRLRTNVELEVSLADKLPSVSLDVPKFEQVLLNLLLNALHAMGRGGGTLRVSTRFGVMAEGEPTDTGSRAAERLRRGDKVVFVSVEDTGCGIPAAEMERIFDPFYTTKPTGEGTGLGLSICRKIIELHGGRIVCRSEPGKGTCMTVTLRAIQSGGQKEKLRDDGASIQVQSD
ncbi:MAG: two-component system sensor histidine kinase NtrB [Verrucomicrobiales bacterium]